MVVIFDIEASCDDRNINPTYKMETIEIGAVKIKDRKIVEKFEVLIEPEYVDSLTPFCTQLTGLTYSDLEGGETFEDAMLLFLEFFYKEKILSCGQFDRKFLTRELIEKCGDKPSSVIIREAINNSHVNLKDFYSRITGRKQAGMVKMASTLGVKLEGTHHRALDDSMNLAKIYLKLEEIREENISKVFTKSRLENLKESLAKHHLYEDETDSALELIDLWGKAILIDYNHNSNPYITKEEREIIERMTKA